MKTNGRVFPESNHHMDGNGYAPPSDTNVNLFQLEPLDDEINGNTEDDNLGLNALFADMPSNLDAIRSVHNTGSRPKTLRRRSTRGGMSTSSLRRNHSIELDAEDVADLIDEQDGSGKMVKKLAAPMAQKKSVRRIQARRQSARQESRNLSSWKEFQLGVAMRYSQLRVAVKEGYKNLELWRSHLKVVEAKFGNGVLSYFLFLKSLLFLNIMIFLVEFCFVVIPQLLNNYSELFPADPTQNTTSAICPATNNTFYKNKNAADHLLDFFTGQGYVNTTIMFYSNYDSRILIGSTGYYYDIPLAYMLVGGAYFILSLLAMVKNLAQGFTESIIESGGFFYSYCNKVFASWDYCVTDEKAVLLKNNVIYKDFEAELAEEKRLARIKNRTKMDRFKIYGIRLLITLLVMALLAGAIYAIIKSVQVSTDPAISRESNSLLTILKRWASSLTISALNIVLPLLFEILTTLEEWSPRVEVAISLWRAVLLKLASVAVLVITLFTTYDDHDCRECWENQIGAQMFNLLFIDFFVTVGITIIAETGRKYVYRYLNCGCDLGKKIGMQEFQIPRNVLDLVYGQSLVWIGTFFAPLIPVIGVLKLIVLFYVKKISLIFNCKPSSQPYQGARSNYFFTLLLLLTFLLCSVAVGWALTRIETSCCGPYRNLQCANGFHMMTVITRTINKLPQVVTEIIDFIQTTVFIFPLFIVIFLLLYYYHAMNKAHEKMIVMLKDQLIMEGRDKRFLMDQLQKASEQKKRPITQDTILT